MKRKRMIIGGVSLGAAGAAVAATALIGLPASGLAVTAASSSDPHPVVSDNAADSLASTLHISRSAAVRRLEQQDVLTDRGASLEKRLGGRSGGSWLDPATGALQVNVLDAQAAALARSQGANPHIVKYSTSSLNGVAGKLSAVAKSFPGNTSWGVDVTTDKVSLTVPAGTPASALLARAGLRGADLSKVDVSTTTQKYRFNGLIGGDDTEIFSNGVEKGICSVGFLATRASGQRVMLTAGHCTQLGTDYRRVSDKRRIGYVQEHVFGTGGDYSVVNVQNATVWKPTGAYVNKHSKPFSMVSVKGSRVAAVGAWLCKSGQTSGWTCGWVTSKGKSWTIYDDFGKTHTVGNLSGASFCTKPGDSGGSVLWPSTKYGDQAQGLVSAGISGSCSYKNRAAAAPNTLFMPIAPVLTAIKLKLLTR